MVYSVQIEVDEHTDLAEILDNLLFNGEIMDYELINLFKFKE